MKKKEIYRNSFSCLLLLGAMFLLSFLLLGLLSVIIWRMDGNKEVLSGGIIVVYILVNLFGGFVAGRIFGKQKFFWGMLISLLFFCILCAVGMLVMGTQLQENGRVFPSLMICMVSGMLGGILSPASK